MAQENKTPSVQKRITKICKSVRTLKDSPHEWNQEFVAKRYGVHRTTIARWEQGEGTFPTICAYLQNIGVSGAQMLIIMEEAARERSALNTHMDGR